MPLADCRATVTVSDSDHEQAWLSQWRPLEWQQADSGKDTINSLGNTGQVPFIFTK